uniref:Uncharacterized protein n=1 Tax=Chromera velia CCMP2878 TaxID=1169474 RepID=A0A0G4I051_9ALVE|eukprot:Cvel_1597.t1-p1 / transcript=Cvel_1597.t1 / gene=Cvel_1597 / organism=Chromera_velia_CCMP2878 / gene_product=hypothetical protein / transcript_product=hypothetical protein / location=Cvel_scaffold57:53657-54256(-) / protein_length=200 / sequence_SO=supercontig / SO=protein_coding / is_pseudo=false
MSRVLQKVAKKHTSKSHNAREARRAGRAPLQLQEHKAGIEEAWVSHNDLCQKEARLSVRVSLACLFWHASLPWLPALYNEGDRSGGAWASNYSVAKDLVCKCEECEEEKAGEEKEEEQRKEKTDSLVEEEEGWEGEEEWDDADKATEEKATKKNAAAAAAAAADKKDKDADVQDLCRHPCNCMLTELIAEKCGHKSLHVL